ncbi:MAG: two-component system, OmpR family, phosphate regulon sensor histidine kinase PhoR [Pseudomonadota bacterium]|nr:two-component system, OmpR family, phosphate regulon sensor histidine kinase PhoR [Pseudomonadota bacterium]
MFNPWSSEFWRLVFYVVTAWLLGLIFGWPVWGLVAGLSFYIVTLAQRFHRFETWANQGVSEPEEFGGILEDIAFRFYRIRMRSRRRKKRLTELLRRWQHSSSALPDATVLLEKNGDILWFNRTASAMLGLKPNDQGRNIGNLIRHPRFIYYINQPEHPEPLEIASPRDISRILSIRIVPYGGVGGETGQLLMLVSDVTHIQRLMTMRRDFIANVSHELRTPLTVIMGYLETLKDDEMFDAATMKEYLARIEAPAQRMKTLVEDLLMLSSLDTGAPPSPELSAIVRVSPLVKSILAEAEQLSQGQHDFVIELDDSIQIRGVEKELHSAFGNLITNAVRYTPAGTTITVSWQPGGDGAKLCVRDNGPGISPEHLPRLTERFYRVDVGRSRSSGGTGLGLAIVKQVLRRHDAELTIVSQVGAGSEFCCLFNHARLQVEKKLQVAR